MSDSNPREARALGEFWDALPGSQDAASSTAVIDPILLDTVVWVTNRDDAPPPDEAFVARLQSELLRAWTPAAQPALPASHILFVAEPRDARPAVHPRPDPAPSRMRWAIAQAATAVLVAVTIIVSVVGIVHVRTTQTRLPNLIPASGQVSDPATAQGLLTEAVVPGLPAVAGYVGIERLIYPAYSDPVTTEPMTGPILLLVTSGALTVSLDGEAAMLSSQQPATLLSTLAATTGEVGTGAALLVPAHTRMTTSNHQERETTALAIAINEDTMSDWIVPYNQTSITQETLARARGSFVPGEASIALSRTTLDPGESLPPPTDGKFRLVAAESKFLGYLTRDPDGTVTNRESEPLVVLVAVVAQPPAT